LSWNVHCQPGEESIKIIFVITRVCSRRWSMRHYYWILVRSPRKSKRTNPRSRIVRRLRTRGGGVMYSHRRVTLPNDAPERGRTNDLQTDRHWRRQSVIFTWYTHYTYAQYYRLSPPTLQPPPRFAPIAIYNLTIFFYPFKNEERIRFPSTTHLKFRINIHRC